MLLLSSVVSSLFFGSTAAAPMPSRRLATANDEFAPQVAERGWKSIVVHHSATHQGSVATIDADHRRRRDAAGKPWLGIGYHFVIGNGHGMADGEIQATFRWQQQLAGAHAGNAEQNEHGIGICVIGNFEEAPPSEKQLAAAVRLVSSLAERYQVPRDKIVRHQDVKATLCPGRLFPWEQVMSDLGRPR